jgi:hypothetical protein
MIGRCESEARTDHYRLHQETGVGIKPTLEGGIIRHVYWDTWGGGQFGVITGMVIEDINGEHHLIIPTSPSSEYREKDESWLSTYKCHIPKYKG